MIFNKNFDQFRNLLSSKSEGKISKEGETNPIIIFEEFISIFLNEFKEKNIYWNNSIFDHLINPENLTENVLLEISNVIKYEFEKEYENPFVDIFYFISLELTRCSVCEKIPKHKINIYFSISIESKEEENIINLINKKLFSNKPYNFNHCSNCGFTTVKDKTFFYNSPLYLLIKFEKNSKIILDEEIDLSSFILTNIGPRKYNFFALISEEILLGEKHYITTIKNNERYKFYSDDIVEDCGDEAKTYGSPLIAIYKGQKSSIPS